MGEVVAFRRPTEDNLPTLSEHNALISRLYKDGAPELIDVTEHEIARYVELLKSGRTPDEASEIVAVARRIRGVCHGD